MTHPLVSSSRIAASFHSVGLTPDDLLRMYHLMTLARFIDQRMWFLQRTARIPFSISAQGHEVAQVAITYALDRERDWLVPYYRSLPACLTKGMTPSEVMLGLVACASDPSSGGRQMPFHWAHASRKILSTSSCVGTQCVHAAGIGYAARVRNSGEVCLVSIGDGGCSQGDWHEALNFAGIHKLPVVFLVENNRYAISVPLRMQMAAERICDRAHGYGVEGMTVEGTAVTDCYAAARAAVDRARCGGGATLLECMVERLMPHSTQDAEEHYRPAEEIAAARSRDPLTKFEQELMASGILNTETRLTVQKKIVDEVEAAESAAMQAPSPRPDDLWRHIFQDESCS